jgi:hypothetical protein
MKFGLPGQKPTCCAKCKTEEMVDLKNKRCSCGTQMTFGLPGKKPTCCAKCKTDEMIGLRSKKCPCGTQMKFGLPGQKPTCCAKCKTEGMVDLKSKMCLNCKDTPYPTTANRNYKGYCAHCFQHLFPKDPLSCCIRSKSKEIIVRDFLNLNFEGFIHDRSITTPDCSCLRRIDHRKLIGDTLLCIETDENQHKGYNKEDELKRYHDVHINWGVGKVVWIRFNPDPYRVDSIRKNPLISTRLVSLQVEIERQMKRIEKGKNNDLVEMCFMYYDEG